MSSQLQVRAEAHIDALRRQTAREVDHAVLRTEGECANRPPEPAITIRSVDGPDGAGKALSADLDSRAGVAEPGPMPDVDGRKQTAVVCIGA